MKEKNELLKHLYKMADIAKVPRQFFDPFKNGKKMPDCWYYCYTWTEKQEDDFKKYLIKYCMEKYKMNRKKSEFEAGMFILSWGWKTI